VIKISNQYIVRRATLTDADGLRSLTKQLLAYRGKSFNEQRFMFGLKKRIDPKNKIHHLYVCESEDKIVGMTLAELIPSNHTEAYLNTLFVDKDHQGHGVGKAMFDFIMDYLKNLEIKSVIINIRKNEPMEVKFFEKYGFKTDFELKPFTCMVKELE